ncbi:uncharacterized protein LOC133925429 [Phragmites australis]|uniref:uncharacterized protein LOC133925429 n=1 Tax=Phragmites australis TaxID=29695 RepID=UPI002D7870FB|nr:uncharacterized protein LOC133925429 [Phragmites australis]
MRATRKPQIQRNKQRVKNLSKLMDQIEELGESGKVDEAEAHMPKVDLLNAEKTALANQADNKAGMLEKKELCETCGLFLVADDALERTQSHVTGKQHISYGMVRYFLTEYKAAQEKAKEEERLAREKKAEERKKQREREYHTGGRDSDTRREKLGERDYDRGHHYERSRGRERSYDHRDRCSSYRNGRDSERGGFRNGIFWNHSSYNSTGGLVLVFHNHTLLKTTRNIQLFVLQNIS